MRVINMLHASDVITLNYLLHRTVFLFEFSVALTFNGNAGFNCSEMIFGCEYRFCWILVLMSFLHCIRHLEDYFIGFHWCAGNHAEQGGARMLLDSRVPNGAGSHGDLVTRPPRKAPQGVPCEGWCPPRPFPQLWRRWVNVLLAEVMETSSVGLIPHGPTVVMNVYPEVVADW